MNDLLNVVILRKLISTSLVSQNVNLVLLLCEAYFHFLPSVWIMFLIVLYEGLLGGACYVNAFYRISQEVKSLHHINNKTEKNKCSFKLDACVHQVLHVPSSLKDSLKGFRSAVIRMHLEYPPYLVSRER